MKMLFSELYNKILELFRVEKSDNSADCAVNRLQVILMHDRTKLDPLIMGKMREELIEVFSKYVVIDKEKLEIDLTNEGDAAALMLNIPIIRSKTEEELEEIRKKLQEEEKEVSESKSDNEVNDTVPDKTDEIENSGNTENIEDTEDTVNSDTQTDLQNENIVEEQTNDDI